MWEIRSTKTLVPVSMVIELNFEHTYAERLDGFYVDCSPADVPEPQLLKFNESLAEELGLDGSQMTPEVITPLFSGNQLPANARPIAQAYAGHQFGTFVPQLGDGRALLLGELIDRLGNRRDVALKGSGRTPFSRGGDGKAAVGPVLREYLMGEAMHALGIPTTRALAAVSTGESVMREQALPGAVLTRVASSHIRVGTFQFFAARHQIEQIQRLADYVIARHDPDLAEHADPYLALLERVIERQASLVARWMLVGFIHGVMNTDNMAISGETIDYGPCAFMETYDSKAVFSSIDHAGRYAFSNQPVVALWNLTRFAETLVPLIDPDDTDQAIERATEVLERFYPAFERHWYRGALNKVGIKSSSFDGTPPTNASKSESKFESEKRLIDDWVALLESSAVDFTLAWRRLANAAEGDGSALIKMFNTPTEIRGWLDRWKDRAAMDSPADLAAEIRARNPIYIPRNHRVEEALAAAVDAGDLGPFDRLLEVVRQPFVEQAAWDAFAEPPPRNSHLATERSAGLSRLPSH